MKKIFLMAAVSATALMSSCNHGTPKADLKTNVDTLSYELGLANTQGIENYFQQMGIDSAYVDEFLKGIKEGASAEKDKKKMAYYAGIQAGLQMKSQMFPAIEHQIFGKDTTKTLSLKNYLAGFGDGVHKKSALKDVKPEDAGKDVQKIIQSMVTKVNEEQYGPIKKASEDFIAAKAKDPSVKQIPGSKVYYKVLKEGKGAVPAPNSMIKVEYEGRLVDGKVFDSSMKRQPGKPVEMPLEAGIKGWNDALKNMPVGSEWEIYIPWDLAYGAQGAGQAIPPFSALIFKVQLDGAEAPGK